MITMIETGAPRHWSERTLYQLSPLRKSSISFKGRLLIQLQKDLLRNACMALFSLIIFSRISYFFLNSAVCLHFQCLRPLCPQAWTPQSVPPTLTLLMNHLRFCLHLHFLIIISCLFTKFDFTIFFLNFRHCPKRNS